jgi:cytochrome c peroxidase
MASRTILGFTGQVILAAAALVLAGCEPSPVQPSARGLAADATAATVDNLQPAADPSGTVATYSTNGALDLGNPFFQSLGTNGRSCGSCHLIENGLGLSATSAQARFTSSSGTDPLFAAVDGANCPTAAPGSGPDAHSLLLNNGLIRIGLAVPGTAQFTLAVVHDPYHCALVVDPQNGPTVSFYRRPLPATNLAFLSAVMFDGRETVTPLNDPATHDANLRTDLSHQAIDATLGHAQASAAPTSAQVAAIVNFELGLFTAQRSDAAAGILEAQGASGGPLALASQQFFPGINDPLGGNPSGAPFDPRAFTAFRAWLSLQSSGASKYAQARTAVARGEEIFDTHPLSITNVKGLNDALNLQVINGTCTTCHDSPNVGNHSLPVPLDIGTSHVLRYEQDPNIRAALAQLSMPDLPVFQISCGGSPDVFTSDPGRALMTGKCGDVNRIKGPILRGLAARAPYFHNGAGATLSEVVAFYSLRFQMGLTQQEQADLVAFLKSL